MDPQRRPAWSPFFNAECAVATHSRPTLNRMFTSTNSSVAAASVCAVALGLFELDLALAGAGPYDSLLAVQVGALIGMVFGYFVVLWATLRACQFAKAVASPVRRFAAFATLGVVSATAAFLAPLLPSAVLAIICKIEVLCPSAADPVLWSYLNLVISFASMPSLIVVVVVVVAVFVIQTRKLRRSEHAT